MRGWREQKEAPCWLRAAHLLGSLEEVSPPARAGVTKDLQRSWVKSVRSGLVGILLLLLLGEIGGSRKRGQQRMRWLDGITDSMDVSLSGRGAQPRDIQGLEGPVHRVGHD